MIQKIYIKRLSGLDTIIPFFGEQTTYIGDEIRGIYIKFKKKLKCGEVVETILVDIDKIEEMIFKGELS